MTVNDIVSTLQAFGLLGPIQVAVMMAVVIFVVRLFLDHR